MLALLVAAAVGAGAWWFGYARYTSVPGVVGLTEADAVERLEGAGLEVVVGEPDYSSTVKRGRVISADPGAGERVLDGDTVAIVVSLGKETYELPQLRNLTVDQAQDKILDTNLAFGKEIPKFSETVPEGIVITSDPKAGTTLRPGAIVDLIVSQGRQPDPGRRLGRQGRRPRRAGAEAARPRGRAHGGVRRRRAGRLRHRPGPRRRHPVQGRHRLDPGLARTRARRGAQRGGRGRRLGDRRP